MLPLVSLPPVVEETSRSPPAPTVEDCDDDDDDLVFQDEVDESDILVPGRSIMDMMGPLMEEVRAGALAEEPELNAGAEPDVEAEKPDEDNSNLNAMVALEEYREPVARPPRPQTPWAHAGDNDDEEMEDEASAFDHSEAIPIDTAPETDAEPELDDSTVFYDVDESYVPQYSSPRKPGTPRGRLATPGSARRKKLGKEPRLEGSPKLDLLKLSSPRKKKLENKKMRSAPDLRLAASAKSPLVEEVAVA
jgi:hypothetical protein